MMPWTERKRCAWAGHLVSRRPHRGAMCRPAGGAAGAEHWQRSGQLLTPLADRFVGDEHPTDQHHLFNIAITETEMEVKPHTVTNDFSGKAVTAVQSSGRVHHDYVPSQPRLHVNVP